MIWFWLPFFVLVPAAVLCALCRAVDAAKVLACVAAVWIGIHLLFAFAASHRHGIEDENCHKAYIYHGHFDVVFHPYAQRSPHTDYDSYTCEQETERSRTDVPVSAVSVPLK